MKTAISIPDPIFQAAEQVARKLKMSRSTLYTMALTAYLEQQQATNITAKLNEIYAESESQLDEEWTQAQSATLAQENW